MMNRQNATRQKVLDVACQLFYSQGFSGTSVRDIANRAKVNVSLIHYYFKSKQGLFESLAIHYFEPYLEMIEQEVNTNLEQNLESLVKRILHYKQEHYQLSCLVNRELTLNTVFAREMLVTYLAKENHLLTQLLFNKTNKLEITYREKLCLVQLKGLLNAPFVMPLEFQESLHSDTSISHFIDVYSSLMMDRKALKAKRVFSV
ncbi:forespore capture DNA-binding protein RefZ [Halobacillus shinanisalinarum]|uniref:Forespore capture DNA-binding protein RefZ n=1 Tax=Halobacillus shinanisalinarum TaxID=2932258 RepID=A0ABY4H2K0_9BACI|nr:forespore capture DNA-binding protein RefZ [Halobacillus shinanisalinarum]UOQ94145.1 forespore capture DNA-binding protein RefZ [Halobacillus shinanisalinarum]